MRIAVWATAAVVGFLVILAPILSGLYLPKQPYLIPIDQITNNIIAIGLLIMITIPGFVEYSNYRWMRQIESSIPRVLRDIAEAIHSGVTLPKAVEQATAKGYGPLSEELERAMALFVLGSDWEKSIMSITKRVKNASVARFATILVEANQAGGKITEVLDMSVELFSNIDQYREEQLNNMKPYTYTIYAAIAVFLIISLVVLTQFLVPLGSSGMSQMGPGNSVTMLDINYYSSILFWASIIESLFAGLIAGKIGDRCYLSGLRHSALLIGITLIFFNVLGGLL